MSCAIELKPHNLGVRVMYSAIIVIVTSGCYGRVGVVEPRHAHRNEAYHEERHEQHVNEHHEEHHDNEHHD